MDYKENINDACLQNLMEQTSVGNQHAFKQLFQYFFKPISQFAFSIVKTKDAATEITDEVFIKLWRNRENILAIQNLRVYIYKAAKNTALNYLSKKANQQITEPFDYISIELKDDNNPEQLMITAEMFAQLKTVVDELPPRCKMIFKLVREDGLKYKEVAEILNLSINTVDAQMVIAVRRITEKVKTHFEFLPVSKKNLS
jgi:RNA polymerase sigma-70 factor (family 1)